jgi:putative inorganic carbon (HCO3(-)) transporter
VAPELARVGGVLACAGLAALILLPRRILRLAALALTALGVALLAAYLAPGGHDAALAAAGVVGVVAAAALAVFFRRWPWLLAMASLACAPARIPVSIGSTEANLLVPLYGVVAGGALLVAFQILRGDRRVRELGPMAWPLALLVAWSGLTLAWTDDLRQGAIDALFFVVPFGLLAVSVSRLPWKRRWLSLLAVQFVGMAAVFGAIGVYQWLTRDVFWNPKVIVGNAFAPFYRVNSIFWDPSIYGRFLVLAILVCLVVVLRGRSRELALAATAAIGVVWVGLLFSFSQSSFAALIAGTVLAAAFVWQWRALVGLGLVLAVVLSVGFSAGPVRSELLDRSSAGLNNATSGRTSLLANGARIAVSHPLEGVGLGSFKRAYADRLGLRGRDPKKAASHNTPVTVAAETGFPGLLLLAWLLAAALVAPFRRVSPTFEGRACLVFGLAIAAVAVHSLFYNALFEDPMFWGLLGLAALGARSFDRRAAR